jgi:hypothetical protein
VLLELALCLGQHQQYGPQLHANDVANHCLEQCGSVKFDGFFANTSCLISSAAAA